MNFLQVAREQAPFPFLHGVNCLGTHCVASTSPSCVASTCDVTTRHCLWMRAAGSIVSPDWMAGCRRRLPAQPDVEAPPQARRRRDLPAAAGGGYLHSQTLKPHRRAGGPICWPAPATPCTASWMVNPLRRPGQV
jgi:hypothetical protein